MREKISHRALRLREISLGGVQGEVKIETGELQTAKSTLKEMKAEQLEQTEPVTYGAHRLLGLESPTETPRHHPINIATRAHLSSTTTYGIRISTPPRVGPSNLYLQKAPTVILK